MYGPPPTWALSSSSLPASVKRWAVRVIEIDEAVLGWALQVTFLDPVAVKGLICKVEIVCQHPHPFHQLFLRLALGCLWVVLSKQIIGYLLRERIFLVDRYLEDAFRLCRLGFLLALYRLLDNRAFLWDRLQFELTLRYTGAEKQGRQQGCDQILFHQKPSLFDEYKFYPHLNTKPCACQYTLE